MCVCYRFEVCCHFYFLPVLALSSTEGVSIFQSSYVIMFLNLVLLGA